ncbi:hypothetical protein H9P43_001574 [Blastocladiella emersonii ATCC 22665]|nr:hypothetical protein H9P43_001574 [Blastocladiella emersonii ATCC 22665]
MNDGSSTNAATAPAAVVAVAPRVPAPAVAAAAPAGPVPIAAGGGPAVPAGGANAAKPSQYQDLELKSDAYSKKINTLKDKALYRFEREMNLTQFKELMMVFQEKASRGGKLTIEEFRNEFAKILQKEMSEEQITLMLMRIGIRGNFVTWDAFGNFMLQRAQEQSKQKESEEQETMLFAIASRLLPLGKPQATLHKEMICNIVYLPGQQRFVTVSRDASICYWSEQFKLQRCFNSVLANKLQNQNEQPAAQQQQAQQSQHLQNANAKQCWISDFALLPDVKKWVFATDTHELSFHDYSTLQPQCKLKLPSNVLCMDYFREELGPPSSSGTGSSGLGHPVGGGAGNNSSTDQYAHEAMLFLGDDQGDVTILTLEPDSLFNPNSPNMLAAAKGNVVNLDKRSFTQSIKRKLHGDWVTRVRYFHEFRSVYSVSPDPKDSLVCGTVNTKKWKFTSASVNKGINAFAVCRFPVALITVGADRKVRLWNPRRITNPQASMKGHAAPIIDVQVQQTLGLCVTLSTDKVIKIWDIRKMACVQTLAQGIEFLHRPDNLLGFVQFVTSTKGGVRLFTGSSFVTEYTMLDTHTARQTTSHLQPIRSVVYNPVCKMIASLCEGSVVQVWEVQNGASTFKLDETQTPREITCIGFDEYSGYRRMLIGTGDGTVHLSSIEGHVLCEMRKRDKTEITAVLHVDAPEGRYFVAAGWQCRLYLYADDAKSEATSMYPTEVWSNPGDSGELKDGRNDDVISMVFVPPHYVVYSTLRGEIWVRTMAGLQVGALTPPDFDRIPLWNRSIEKVVVLRPVVATKPSFDPAASQEAALLPIVSPLESAHIASCGMDGSLRFWNLLTMSQVFFVAAPGVVTMCASPKREYLITGNATGGLCVWSLLDSHPVIVRKWQAHVRAVTTIETVSATSAAAAGVSFELVHGAAAANLPTCEYFIISGSADNNVRCWSPTGEYIGTFGQPTPWDLANRATWRHPDRPHDVAGMLRSAEQRNAAAAAPPAATTTSGIKVGPVVAGGSDSGDSLDALDDDGDDTVGIRTVLSRPSTRSGRNKREIGKPAPTDLADAASLTLSQIFNDTSTSATSSSTSLQTDSKPPSRGGAAGRRGQGVAGGGGSRKSALARSAGHRVGSSGRQVRLSAASKARTNGASNAVVPAVSPMRGSTPGIRSQLKTADLLKKNYQSWFAKSRFAQENTFSLAGAARAGREAQMQRVAAGGGGGAGRLGHGGKSTAATGRNPRGITNLLASSSSGSSGSIGGDQVFHALRDYALDDITLPPIPAPLIKNAGGGGGGGAPSGAGGLFASLNGGGGNPSPFGGGFASKFAAMTANVGARAATTASHGTVSLPALPAVAPESPPSRSSSSRRHKDEKRSSGSSSSKPKSAKSSPSSNSSKKHKKSSSKKHSSSSSKSHRSSRRRDADEASSSDSSASDDEAAMWVEKTVAPPPPPTQAPAAPAVARDSWMTGAADEDPMASLFGGARDDRKSAARAAAKAEKKKSLDLGEVHLSSREINPYWKNGGRGLPSLAAAHAIPSSDDGNESASSTASTVSHLTLRKIDRILELAEEEGRPVEEVGAERFGSRAAFVEAYAVYKSARKPRAAASGLRIGSTVTDEETGFASSDSLAAGSSESATPTMGLGRASFTASRLPGGLPTLDPRGRPTEAMLQAAARGGGAAGGVAADEESMSLEEMVRREKLGLSEDMDRAFSRRIARDGGFKDEVDYMDEQSDRLGLVGASAAAKPKRSHSGIGSSEAGAGAKRRKLGMDDFLRQNKALQKCQFCFRDGKLPEMPTIVSIGVAACLMLVPYHSVATCMIVPMEHMVSTLEGDDAFWSEVRNFMKCLIQMYGAQGKSVLFAETVLDPSWHRHTVIEVIPVPQGIHEDAAGYLRTAFRMDAEADEWTQHEAVVDTRKRGGFRRALVPNLPYVHVWLDLDGGLAHIIEERTARMNEHFVREVLGSAMDVDPALFRKQRWLSRQTNHDRVRAFVKGWEAYDWTKMLEGGEYAG